MENMENICFLNNRLIELLMRGQVYREDDESDASESMARIVCQLGVLLNYEVVVGVGVGGELLLLAPLLPELFVLLVLFCCCCA